MLSKKIIDRAVDEALNSPHPQFRHGAVLFNKGKIYNSSSNVIRYTSFARRFTTDLCFSNLHAEIGAILNQPRDTTENCDVLVVRISRTGVFGNSKPCDMCAAAMSHVGIRNVWYTNVEGEIVKCRLN